MEFLQPRSLADAIAARAEFPGAVAIAGGTDVMVEINFDARRPPALLDLNRVAELTSWRLRDGLVRLGAGVTYTRLITELGSLLPGLAMAARIVRDPRTDVASTVAPAASSTGWQSPAGEAAPRLPPTVPRLRICGDPTVRAAMARPGRTVPSSPMSRA